MAQWLGQYTGNTHATRAAELEVQLRHAISRFRDFEDSASNAKRVKAVRTLAKRLLAARIRCVKAKIVAAEIDAARRKRSDDVTTLREELASIEASGSAAILAEFGIGGVDDAFKDGV